MSADGLVELLVSDAYGVDPPERQYAPGRLARTEARFITAAVDAYCPGNNGKVASLMADPTPGSHVSMHRGAPARDVINVPTAWQQPTDNRAARLPHAIEVSISASSHSRNDPAGHAAAGPALASRTTAVPAGDLTQPDPPQIPAPAPPAAHIQPPHPPMASPPRPQQPPPPPQALPPPPPQQPPPPAVGPQPGSGAGSSGDGSTGGNDGGGPAEQSPPPDRSPGFVTLAP